MSSRISSARSTECSARSTEYSARSTECLSARGNDSNTVKVVARFRPINATDNYGGTQMSCAECVTFPGPNQVEVKMADDKEGHTFEFDAVYGAGAKQSTVFDFTGKQIVEDVFKGYNGTIFVYGQTGSGKTHTMMGPTLGSLQGYCDDPELKGIIPRAIEMIFNSVEAADEAVEFTLKVSYVEIYMERIRDLLNPKKTNLQLHEDFHGGRGVYVVDATEAYVSDVDEVFRLMRTGAANRTVASTRMNEESSRSHSIFQITVTQKHNVHLEQKSGKLFLVDLAGSERAGKTKADGLQLEEAKLINKSLSTLGMVINALTDKRSTHVPYRDSKLTRLLQDSIGGNSRTTLVICCSPSRYNDHETLSTLRFGERAKKIRNKAKINREWTVAELKALLAKADREITMLKKLKDVVPESARTGSEASDLETDWQEMRARLHEEREDLTQQLTEAREQLLQSQQKVQALRVENESLRELDKMWESEFCTLRHRLDTISFCYEQEKEANSEKVRAMEGILQHCEEVVTAMQSAKVHSAKLRQQVEQLVLMDGWVSNASSADVHQGVQVEDLTAEASGELVIQQELHRLQKENEMLQSALITATKDPSMWEESGEICRENSFLRAMLGGKDKVVQDLESKHENLMELEAGLEEARDAYNKLVFAAGTKALKKRLLYLEQQAELQTENYQEIYNENSTLRLEMQLAEKKLAIRNERIENLKAGLKEEKRHLTELQEQFALEREKFKAEVCRYKEELNYWKARSLSRENNILLGKKSKNVVKIIKGGQRHNSPALSETSELMDALMEG